MPRSSLGVLTARLRVAATPQQRVQRGMGNWDCTEVQSSSAAAAAAASPTLRSSAAAPVAASAAAAAAARIQHQ